MGKTVKDMFSKESRKMRLKMAHELINDVIEETIRRYADNPNCSEFILGWRDTNTVGSDHGHNLFAAEIIKIVEMLELEYYLTLKKNADNEDTPSVRYY